MLRRLLKDQPNPDSIAVIEDDREIRYRELQQKAFALQLSLPAEPQENIAILLPNGGDFIAAFWGVISTGKIAFPLNVLMTKHEILPLLKQASVKKIITSLKYKSIFEDARAYGDVALTVIYMENIGSSTSGPGSISENIDPEKPAVLLGTSGTVGKSKIVQLTEKNIEASVLGYLERLRCDRNHSSAIRFLLTMPFSSAYGLMMISACLRYSFPIVLFNHIFTLDLFYHTVEKHKITHYEGSTSTIVLMGQLSDKPILYDICTLRYCGFGGSKISGNAIKKLSRAFPEIGFYQGYGMTEASPLIAKHPEQKLEKADSVGLAIQGLEIGVETEKGITHAPEVIGEIVVKGTNVMLGYLENEKETKHTVKKGYLHTGDIGYLDEEGYLFIRGRKKNMIIVRGFNVYPEEVEDCIQNSHLVKECRVYARQDKFENEMICADVVPINSLIRAETIKSYCEEHLAEYKRPRMISLCKSIQKNLSGKITRQKEI